VQYFTLFVWIQPGHFLPANREPNRNIGLFGFRLSVRFLVLHCSLFGFGFSFLLKPNRGTEQTEVHAADQKTGNTSIASRPQSLTAHSSTAHQDAKETPIPQLSAQRQRRSRSSRSLGRSPFPNPKSLRGGAGERPQQSAVAAGGRLEQVTASRRGEGRQEAEG